MKGTILACAAACSFAVPTSAGQLQPVGAPVPVTALQPATGNVLRVGTPVSIRTREELTTKGKKLKVGQRISLEVADPVMVGDVTAIPVGTPVVGEITEIRNKGMWGKSGHLAARMLYATVNGRQVRLSGAFDDKGRAGGVGAAAASTLVFLPAGFFMTGTSARIAPGTLVQGLVDEDVPVSAEAVPVTPLVALAPVK